MPAKSIILFFVITAYLQALPVHFEIKDVIERNLVQFVSDTPLEKTVGFNHALSGWIDIDPEKVVTGIKGRFEVDVRLFDTGNEQRNEHFREKFMNAAEFPLAAFTPLKVVSSSKPTLGDGTWTTVKVEGEMKIRGVSKILVVPVKMMYFKESDITKQRLPGNLIRISSNFEVDLLAFAIPWPENLKNRLTRNITVMVDVMGTDIPASSLVSAPDGPKVKEKK